MEGVQDTLARAGIFQGVDPEAVAALINEMDTVTFPKGTTIFDEGEPGDRLYIIVDGKIKLALVEDGGAFEEGHRVHLVDQRGYCFRVHALENAGAGECVLYAFHESSSLRDGQGQWLQSLSRNFLAAVTVRFALYHPFAVLVRWLAKLVLIHHARLEPLHRQWERSEHKRD